MFILFDPPLFVNIAPHSSELDKFPVQKNEVWVWSFSGILQEVTFYL